MKPLYITYSNELEPFNSMANELCHKVKKLNCGDCIHLHQSKPGAETNFSIAMYSMIFAEVKKIIVKRPIIILDADHILLKPIIEIFNGDWDVGAVYRSKCINKYGRHDYCSGLVLLNNRRPDRIIKFCYDWLHSMSSYILSPGFCPEGLKQQGWQDTWWNDQASLNEIITVDEVTFGKIYTIKGYRVLPLHWNKYTLPSKEAVILHLKGGRKKQWKKLI